MRDEDVIPFLRAIHDRPADHLPRLVFADFLEEHGDWRGPLLRRPAPVSALRDREATDAWHAHLGNVHGVQWIGSRRGLLSVIMPAAAVYELPDSHLLKEAFRQGWVEHFDLTDNVGIPPWADQLDLQELPRLGFQSVDDETLEHLPPLPAVRELYLNNCWATRPELEWLKDFPRLEFVHASCMDDQPISPTGGSFRDSDLIRLSAIPKLRSLTIHARSFTNTGFERIGQMRGLNKLDISIIAHSGAHVTDVGVRELRTLDALRELTIVWTELTDLALGFLTDLPSLRILRLRGQHVSDGGIARFRAARPDVVVCR